MGVVEGLPRASGRTFSQPLVDPRGKPRYSPTAMPIDLHAADKLEAACQEADQQARAEGHYAANWRDELATFLGWVRSADVEQRRTQEFQKKLWDENPVTSVGMGTVRVDPALGDAEFRNWVASIGLENLPEDVTARTARLEKIHREMIERVTKHTDRTPHLKILRVMAALFPRDFTTIADGARLRQLHDALCPPERGTAVARSVRIMIRLGEVLGEVKDEPMSLSDRMTLPWMLYSLLPSEEDETTSEPTETKGGEIRLKPLPAARRRKGLTAIGGTFQRMLAVLQEIEDGMTREDLIDYLRTAHPGSKTSSYGTLINALMSEFGVLKRAGELYKLTPAGEAVLESGEADPLAEWLLTRILGVDHVLRHLSKHGPTPNKELLKLLQTANPGWTATYAPSAIMSWLRAMDVLANTDDGIALTERGQAWTEQIHWDPQPLEPDADEEKEVRELDELVDHASTNVSVPALPIIQTHIADQGVVLAPSMVRDLHAGLNSHARRHLAVLAGLSGTGKTLLARTYGAALVGGDEAARGRVKIIPVQPGWYDPGSLLGYPNPVKPGEYVRTPFLEFLFKAARDPERPYVAILDEMNLSHPEQYMAPLLSAMETGSHVDLHAEGDDLDGVPPSLPYPANLFVLGTVNMDETTHGLSDKVLDRAFVLEFWTVNLDGYPKWGKTGLQTDDEKRVRSVLSRMLEALQPARLHFGWRVVDDVFGFLRQARVDESNDVSDALDAVLYAKVMPKLRGEDTPRFRDALTNVRSIAADEGLGRCKDKADDLLHDLETTGSARFWR